MTAARRAVSGCARRAFCPVAAREGGIPARRHHRRSGRKDTHGKHLRRDLHKPALPGGRRGGRAYAQRSRCTPRTGRRRAAGPDADHPRRSARRNAGGVYRLRELRRGLRRRSAGRRKAAQGRGDHRPRARPAQQRRRTCDFVEHALLLHRRRGVPGQSLPVLPLQRGVHGLLGADRRAFRTEIRPGSGTFLREILRRRLLRRRSDGPHARPRPPVRPRHRQYGLGRARRS